MYIWPRLAYPHRTSIIGCVRSFSLRQWRRFSNNTAVGSAAAVDGPPKSTPEIVQSLTKKFVAVGRDWKHDRLRSDPTTVKSGIGKYCKVRFQKVVVQCEVRKLDVVSKVQVRKHDVVGKDQFRKTDVDPKIRIRKKDILGKGQFRKNGAVPKVQVRKHGLVPKVPIRKQKVFPKVLIRKQIVVPKVQIRKQKVVPKVQIRKQKVVSKGQLPKTGAVDKVHIRKHNVVDFRPGKSTVASAATIKNIVEDESLNRARSLDHTHMALASHCAAARNLDHTLQPRMALTPDDEYLSRSPVLHDVPPDGKSSDIEVSPHALEEFLLNSTTPMGHVSFSRRSGAAFFAQKWKTIRRRRARIVIRRKLIRRLNGLIIGTATVFRRCIGRSPEGENANCTNQELSSVGSSKKLAQERTREQALRVSSPPAAEMRASMRRGKSTPMRPKRRKILTRVITRILNPSSSRLANGTYSLTRRIGQLRGKRILDLAFRHAKARSCRLRALARSSKLSARMRVMVSSLKPLIRMTAVGSSSNFSARLKKVRSLQSRFERTPSPRLQVGKLRRNETVHVGSDDIEPIITKYIFDDEKQAKQDALTEKVLTGLDDLLYTYNKLQLRKPRGNKRDNAVEWPSRRKYMRRQRVDMTGQPLGEAPEDHCAAETAKPSYQTIVEPQVPSPGGTLDAKGTTDVGYQLEDVRPEASFGEDYVAAESVESVHQAEVELPRISLAYDLEDPLYSARRDTGKGREDV